MPEFMGQKGVVLDTCPRSDMSICVRFESINNRMDVFMPEELGLVEYTPITVNKEKMELLIYRQLISECEDPDPDGILAELVWDKYFDGEENELDDTDDLKASQVFNEILTKFSKVMIDALKTAKVEYKCSLNHSLAKITCIGKHDFPLECLGVCEYCQRVVNT
jgi:hypothetical protein